MDIKVFGNLNHHVYGWMRKKAEYGFRQLGHTIVEENPELVLTFGSNNHWDEIKDLPGRKVFSCHGVDWWRGWESSGNDKIKSMLEHADNVVYQSNFARHMAQKAFNASDGILVYNAGIPDFPEKFNTWNEGETIHVATCGVFRAWKRLFTLEEKIKLLVDRGNKVELHVVGKDGTPPAEYIHYYGMKDHPEIKEIYRKCHIYISLSFNDFSPATTGEAQCWGLPVIVTNSGGSKDVVKEGSGIVIQTDPFIDEPFPIHSEDKLPKVDDDKFMNAFWEIMHHLPEYQQANKEWATNEMNIIKQAEKFLSL